MPLPATFGKFLALLAACSEPRETLGLAEFETLLVQVCTGQTPEPGLIERAGTERLEVKRLTDQLKGQQWQIKSLASEVSAIRSHLGLTGQRAGLFGYEVEKR